MCNTVTRSLADVKSVTLWWCNVQNILGKVHGIYCEFLTDGRDKAFALNKFFLSLNLTFIPIRSLISWYYY